MKNDAAYWRKGDKAKDLGVPFRHARDKAGLLLEPATESQLREVIRRLIAVNPGLALDLLCEVTDPDRNEEQKVARAYLLVEITDEQPTAARVLTALLGNKDRPPMDGIISVTEHGPGCCCKNCPWDGNHA